MINIEGGYNAKKTCLVDDFFGHTAFRGAAQNRK